MISWSFVQVAFPLQFPFANAVRLVPMYFCQPYVTASKSNAGHTLHLPPTALAVATPKTFEIANPLTGGNCLKNRDFSDNLKVHCEIVPFKECPPLSRITFRMSSRSQRREATLVTVISMRGLGLDAHKEVPISLCFTIHMTVALSVVGAKMDDTGDEAVTDESSRKLNNTRLDCDA